MKKLLYLFLLVLIGCTISQKIVYETDDLSAHQTIKPIPAAVEVRIFKDNRASIKENEIVLNNPRQIILDGVQTCVNSEKHYKKDTVVNQISRILVEHFNKARLFNVSFYNHSPYSNYLLTGTLNSFYCEQEYSSSAAFGSLF